MFQRIQSLIEVDFFSRTLSRLKDEFPRASIVGKFVNILVHCAFEIQFSTLLVDWSWHNRTMIELFGLNPNARPPFIDCVIFQSFSVKPLNPRQVLESLSLTSLALLIDSEMSDSIWSTLRKLYPFLLLHVQVFITMLKVHIEVFIIACIIIIHDGYPYFRRRA